jgi:hypothetical protein
LPIGSNSRRLLHQFTHSSVAFTGHTAQTDGD